MNIIYLIFSKCTIIELIILLIFFFLLNKFIFLLLVSILFFFIYKSNKQSNIPLPIELEKAKMKAFMENIDTFSGSLKDKFCFKDKVNIPHLKSESDILVKIYAASLNHIDTVFLFSSIPFVRWFRISHLGVGSDFAGKIIQIGKNVTKFKIGDEVFGFAKGGAFQEYGLTNESRITLKPDSISFEEASSIATCFNTAYTAITYNFGTDVEDKNILIVGASGGIGMFSISIAKYLKFGKIYGVCSSKNKKLVESFGVDKVLCYDEENYLDECDEKFDLIFDNAYDGKKEHFEKYFSLLKPDIGEYVAINGLGKERILGGLRMLFGKKFKTEKKNFHSHFGSMSSEYLDIAGKMIKENIFKIYAEKHSFDKKEIINGLDILDKRRTRGKLVYTIYQE